MRSTTSGRRSVNPAFWALAHLGSRIRFKPPAALRPGRGVLPPDTIRIPTRHGSVRALVYRPPGLDGPPSVVVHLHGGGFINRYPEQDGHIAGHLAAHLGVAVVLPDYDTAPRVRYPIAEQQAVDLVRWVQQSGDVAGWDGSRVFLSGVSAGAKLAVNACQQLRSAGHPLPLAVALIVPVTDVTRTDRASSIPKPAINGFVQRLVGWSYFPDVARHREPLASPRFDPALAAAMPPTLILTAEHDTLAPEGADLALTLRVGGVEVQHHQFPGVDHDFISSAPLGAARAALARTEAFFRTHLERPRPRPSGTG